MNVEQFRNVDTWVFDLDNTLYPPSVRLFDQIEVRMTQWVMRALNVSQVRADFLRKHYWETYGTTLAGLMREHDVDPAPYLEEVHDIDFSVLSPAPDLAKSIRDLKGRKIIYTNGCAPYARNVLSARGLLKEFDEIYGVEHANFLPKPERAAFETVFDIAKVSPMRSAMFEDEPRNLKVPRAMGMRTIHVAPEPSLMAHIEHHTDDLTSFLVTLGGD